MKHLKLFEGFIHSELEADIEDILIDLRDLGIEFSVEERHFKMFKDISIDIWSDSGEVVNVAVDPGSIGLPHIEWVVIKDNILRLFDYLEGLGYVINEYEFGTSTKYDEKRYHQSDHFRSKYKDFKYYTSDDGEPITSPSLGEDGSGYESLAEFFKDLDDNKLIVFDTDYAGMNFTAKLIVSEII